MLSVFIEIWRGQVYPVFQCIFWPKTFQRIMDVTSLEEEQASIQQDILKLQLHSVPLTLNWEEDVEEEEEEESFDDTYLLTALEDPDQPSTSGLNTVTTNTSVPETEVQYDSETDDEGAETEEEVIDLSSDLSPTPNNLLKLNIAYQEVIQQQLHLADQLLHHNKCKQEELDADLDEDFDPKSTKPKADLGLCIAPYFRAHKVMGPMPHPDVLQRKKEIGDNFIPNAMPGTMWKSTAVRALKEGVAKEAVRVRTEPQLAKLGYLEEKYQNLGTEDLKKKIKEVSEQIAEIKEMKPASLFGERLDEHDWEAISNIYLEGKKSASECSMYWKNNLHPKINKRGWSAKEDKKLKDIVKKHQERDWPTIAKELNTGRTPLQCIQRYEKKHNIAARKKPWTPEEDAKLTKLVEEYRVGTSIPYSLVALKMGTRNNVQCVHRWSKTLDPKYKKVRWTPEEDIKLLRGIAKHGFKWARIRDLGLVPGRNDSQMRERYQNVLSGSIKRGPWCKEEDDKLLEMVAQYGEGNWSSISRGVEGRTDSQVFKRWHHLQKVKESGKPVWYKKPGLKTGNQLGYLDTLQKIRTKLMESLHKEVAEKKGVFAKNASIKGPTEASDQQEKPPSPEPESPLSPPLDYAESSRRKLPKEHIVKVSEVKKMNVHHEFEKRLDEKLGENLTSDEVFQIYQKVCTPKVRKEIESNPAEKILNAKISGAISDRFRPYKIKALKKGTNLNIIREKVVGSVKSITPRVMFIHYIKAMNIDAEKTLSAIRKTHTRYGQSTANMLTQNMEGAENGRKSPRKRKRDGGEIGPDPKVPHVSQNSLENDEVAELGETNIGLQNGITNKNEEIEKNNEKEENSTETKENNENTESRSLTKLTFNRNHYLPLCAPNRATLRAYKILMQDRDARVKSAKKILNLNSKENEGNEQGNEGTEEKKYKPEELIKNIQNSTQQRIFRSRFVSLFAWPTILSSLVPYNRVGSEGILRAVVKFNRNDRNEGDRSRSAKIQGQKEQNLKRQES